jgi:hypothetical protein
LNPERREITMNRRRFMQAAGATGITAIAGCTGGSFFEVQSSPTSIPPVPENRPNAVYYPSHLEGMQMLGTSSVGNMENMGNTSNTSGTNGSGGTNDSGGMDGMDRSGGTNGSGNMGGTNGSNGSSGMDVGGTSGAGDYAFGLMYSYPHRFWTVSGTERQKTVLQDADSMHMMASVWEPRTRTVLPDTGLSVEISQKGDLVSEEVIYPMLSQQMGFHYGANFELPGDGTYTAELSAGAMNTRRTGAFEGMFSSPQSVEIEFDYSEQAKNEISYRTLEDRAGQKGAVSPMDMPMVPQAYAPKRADLPGRVIGEGTSGDAKLLVTHVESPPAGVEGKTYLAASARTPYNRLVIPAMALSGTLTRGGQAIFDGELKRTLDPDLGYHYGAAVESVRSGDELAITVDTPSQTARHEGYETAFLDGMKETTVTVP